MNLRELIWSVGINNTEAASSKINDLDKSVDDIKSKMQSADKETNKINKSFDKLGNKAKTLGKTMTKKLTLPLAAGFSASIKSAIDWEDSFSGVAKTFSGTENELKDVESRLKSMSTMKPVDGKLLNQIAADAGQLGVTGVDNIEKFTSVIADLDVATNLGAESAGDIARFANIMDMDINNVDRLGSTIVELGNNSATTEADIMAMASRLGSTSKLLGINEHQTMALSATLASLGINAEAGGTAMSKTMQQINTDVSNGGENLQKYSKLAGMSADEFSKSWKSKPLETIQSMLKGLDDLAKSGGNVTGVLQDLGFNDMRQLDTLQRLIGGYDLLGDSMNMAENAWKNNTALSEEAATKYSTLKSELAMTGNKIKLLAIEIGDKLTPYIAKAGAFVSDLTEKWSNLSPEAQNFIIKAGLATMAIGPLLFGLSSFALKIHSGIGALRSLNMAISSAGGAAKIFSGALSFMISPVGLAIVAIGALIVAGVMLYKNWDKVKAKAGALGNKIKSKFQEASSATQSAFNSMKNVVVSALSAIANKWNAIKNFFKHPIKGVISIAESGLSKITGGAKGKATAKTGRIPHAKGLDYVPFDEYPANLHKGEMVLTAAASEQFRNLGGNRNSLPNISKTKNTNNKTVNEGTFNPTVIVNMYGNEKKEEGQDVANTVREEIEKLFRTLQLQRV